MVGAGLFVVFAPAVAAAGDAIIVALGIAAVIAGCNAHSSARLAQRHPAAGGTYVYAREHLGPFWGHLAGWAFIVGKVSSCAAMALAIGAYAWPDHQRLVALAVLGVVTFVNLSGIEKSAAVSVTIAVAVLVVVTGVVIALFAAPGASSAGSVAAGSGVLEAAGLLFFAFAGYARLATLGEEVRDPERTIPRAIAIAVALVVVVYLAAALALLHVLGAARLASSSRPFVSGLEAAGIDELVPLVIAASVLAAGGALLSLMLGVSRTVLAMARDRHLPRQLALIDTRRSVPAAAEVAVAAVVGVVVLLGDVTSTVAFSSFCVLTYYAIANASALSIDSWPLQRVTAWVGLGGCVLLAIFLPVSAVAAGVAALAVGAISYRLRAA